jgi:hypothetical protein
MHILRLVPVLLAACGSSQHAPAAPPAPDVAGHWVSDCTPSPDGKGNFKMAFHNTAGAWQMAYEVFGDPACTAELVEVDVAGPYEIGAPSPTVAGARDAVFHFTSKTVTPKVQGLADAINGMSCGGGFAVGVAKDVYEHGCPELGQYPKASCAADYDLVARDGDRLRFSQRPADNNLCTPDHRPHALSQLVLHHVD